MSKSKVTHDAGRHEKLSGKLQPTHGASWLEEMSGKSQPTLEASLLKKMSGESQPTQEASWLEKMNGKSQPTHEASWFERNFGGVPTARHGSSSSGVPQPQVATPRTLTGVTGLEAQIEATAGAASNGLLRWSSSKERSTASAR